MVSVLNFILYFLSILRFAPGVVGTFYCVLSLGHFSVYPMKSVCLENKSNQNSDTDSLLNLHFGNPQDALFNVPIP